MPTILTLHLQHSPPLNKGCGQRTFLSQSPHPMHTSGEKERKKEEDKYVAHTVQHQSSGAVSKSQTRAPIPNSSYSLCGRTLYSIRAQALYQRVRPELPSLIVPTVSVDVHCTASELRRCIKESDPSSHP